MAYTTIDDPSAYFKVQLYTGNDSSRSITFDDTDTNMQPDLVWIKGRSETVNHVLFDSVRGAQKELNPDLNEREETQAQMVTSFDSDGFGMGTSGGSNSDTITYVAWCWKESADAGFDIVGYTGNATDRTISHSLSAVPKVILVKRRTDADSQWAMYHHTLTNNNFLVLNTTGASATTDHWNDTDPTSSVFSINSTGDEVNVNTSTYIAYLWAEKQGFSKFGSYTGNGNADGTFVYTGFRPAWVMVKKSSGTNAWLIHDVKRSTLNPMDNQLFASTNGAEDTTSTNNNFDFLSNGFKARNTGDAYNGSSGTYIYMAFAEAPFVNSNGVPCNAR